MPTSTVDKIIDAAENQARVGGYHGFSFREIAKDIGIKSASIHYHFPTKEDLAAELAKRYTEKFNQYLNTITETESGLQEQINQYAQLFYHAIKNDEKMCLCGLFAAESSTLPQTVKEATQLFFEAQLQWLSTLFSNHNIAQAEDRALQLLANLEGAMLLAKAFESEALFMRAANLTIIDSH